MNQLERRCLPVYCDLGDSEQIERTVAQVIGHYGRIDILVNNARAIIGDDKVPVTELSKEVWDLAPLRKMKPMKGSLHHDEAFSYSCTVKVIKNGARKRGIKTLHR